VNDAERRTRYDPQDEYSSRDSVTEEKANIIWDLAQVDPTSVD
jgi:hypothetical protein